MIIEKEKEDEFNNSFMEFLNTSPIFKKCTSQDLARLISTSSIRYIGQDKSLFHLGENANFMYFIARGSFNSIKEDEETICPTGDIIGIEAGVGGKSYLNDIIAFEESVVIEIPGYIIKKIMDHYPEMKTELVALLYNQSHSNKLEFVLDDKTNQEKQMVNLSQTIGWICVTVIPPFFIYFRDLFGLDWASSIFIGVFLSAVGMWVFRLYDEFITSLFSILVILILGIAPPSIVLSGFISSSFYMAMSVFGLAIVLVASGITYRIVLFLLSIVPKSKVWYALTLFFTGVLLTPIIPSANGRVTLGSPLIVDMKDSLGYQSEQRASTQLSVAMFMGLNLFSTIFLSSKTINFVVFGLLPTQTRDQFTWGYWFFASFAAMLVMGICTIALLIVFFRNSEVPSLSKKKINIQLQILGPITKKEWFAILSVLLFIVGIATSSFLKIHTAWIGLSILYMLLAFGMLTKKEFQNNINWPFLFYLAGLIGLVNTMKYLGVDLWLGKQFSWMIPYMRNDFSFFILLLIISIFLVRLLVPNNATVILFVTIFLPMANQTSISPWVIGFIILTISNIWFLPYQSTYYLLFQGILKSKRIYSEKLMIFFNAIVNIIIILSIYASLPFWKWLNLI